MLIKLINEHGHLYQECDTVGFEKTDGKLVNVLVGYLDSKYSFEIEGTIVELSYNGDLYTYVIGEKLS